MTLAGPAWAVALLRDARVARLATADASGRPLVLPVCHAFDGARIYSAVDAKPKRTRALRRLRNIAENPHVSLVVDEYAEDWTTLAWVVIEGRAAVLEGAAAAPAVDLLVAKYPQYREGAQRLDRAHATVIAIDPTRLLSWRFA